MAHLAPNGGQEIPSPCRLLRSVIPAGGAGSGPELQFQAQISLVVLNWWPRGQVLSSSSKIQKSCQKSSGGLLTTCQSFQISACVFVQPALF